MPEGITAVGSWAVDRSLVYQHILTATLWSFAQHNSYDTPVKVQVSGPQLKSPGRR